MLDASEQANLLHSFAGKPWYAFGRSKSHLFDHHQAKCILYIFCTLFALSFTTSLPNQEEILYPERYP
jgi:hypothetical protein